MTGQHTPTAGRRENYSETGGTESDGTDSRTTGLTRRKVLAATSVGGALTLAGCNGWSEESCYLDLNKRTDGEFHYGGQGTYVFEICSEDHSDPFSNCNNNTLPITIEDDLPAGISFASVSGNWTANVSGGTVELTNDTYGTLSPGDCLTVEMTVDIAPASGFSGSSPHQIENCATVFHDDVDHSRACVTHDITENPAGECRLTMSKEAGEFTYGGQGTYSFDVCNEGDATCSEPLELTDDLPDGITFDSIGGDWSASVSGGAVTATNSAYGSLAPGECFSFEMTVSVAPADQFSGSSPHQVENCATLLENGQAVAEECVTHDVTVDTGGDPCPPVSLDLNTGWDQDSGATLGDGTSDDDWTVTADSSNTLPVPTPATVVNQSDSPGNWPAPFADTRWISHTADARQPSDFISYEYEYCFCLRDGFENPVLDLRIQADNRINDLRLNGTSLSFLVNGSFQGAPLDQTYADPSLFQAGENCLTLIVGSRYEKAAVNVEGTVTADNADCDCTPCDPTLSKEVGEEFTYGGQGSYLFTVCNEGEAECTEPFDVADDLPDGISFASAGGAWSGSVSGGEVTVTNDSYGGLAPGDCIEFEMIVDVAPEDEFPGDLPSEVENCATLLQGGEIADEDCVTHDVTVDTGGDPCPPVSLDLNTGWDQDSGATLGDGDNDDDWQLVVDGSGSGPVPRPATVVNQSDSPGNWPAPFADSRWLSHAADAAYSPPPNSTYEYEYCFCLRDGFENPELALQIRADNTIVDIRLNDISLPFSGDGGFQNAPIDEIYTDPDIFQAGENCLTLVVENELNETGLNVAGTMSADNADCDCEPGSDCELSLEKSTTGEFVRGQQHRAGYVYEVCNQTESECSGELELTDPLPDGIAGPVDPGQGLTGSVTNGTFEGTIQYGGLAPGECLTRTVFVTVEDADAVEGDPPQEVQNCATLEENGESAAEDCVTHPITPR